jgi:WD40 repeat protein
MTAMPPARENPYIGPRSFRPKEKLYGREDESARLFDLLMAERIALLYSPSGAGKSSLINTLLTEKLETSDFVVLPTLRVNGEPPSGLNLGLDFNRYAYSVLMSLEETRPEPQRIDPEKLAEMKLEEYLGQCFPQTDGRSQFLIFDQFEELLTLNPTDRAAKVEFLNQVGVVLRNRDRWALFAMREDYLAGLDPYLRLIPTRLATRFRLDLLDLNSASQAIRMPAHDQGVEFQDEAVNRLLDDLSRIKLQQLDGSTLEQPGLYVEPVQLQVVCRRLWERLNPNDASISAADISAVGDADMALAGYYADQVAKLAATSGVGERRIREWIESKMISSQGIRLQVLRDKDASAGMANPVIDGLVSAYLVRVEKRGGATWYELAHDRLIRPIRMNNADWYDQNLSLLQRRAALWYSQHEPEGLLLRDPALSEAERWVDANRSSLTEVELDFLAKCRLARKRAKRERQINIAARGLSIVATLVSIVGFYLFLQARHQSVLANARELAASSIANLTIDPQRSLLLALEAAQVNDHLSDHGANLQVADALQRSLQALQAEQKFTLPAGPFPFYAVDYAPDGKHLVSAGPGGKLVVWDTATRQMVYQIDDPSGFNDVRFSGNGQSLASGSLVGSVDMWDANSGKSIRSWTNGYPVYSVAFSPDGARLAATNEAGQVLVWDVASGSELFRTASISHPIFDLDYDPKGRWLAGAGDDKVAWIWDARNGGLLLTIEGHTHIVGSVRFSADGNMLVTASEDGTAIVWKMASDGRSVSRVSTLEGHIGKVSAAVFRPDGKKVATGGVDASLRLYDVASGAEELVLTTHIGPIYALGFSPDGKYLTSSSADGSLRVTILDFAELIDTARQHLTRSWTLAECKKYLYIDRCP